MLTTRWPQPNAKKIRIVAQDMNLRIEAINERRIKRREERVTKRFPRAGKYILALTNEPQSTRAWEVGAKGKVAVGKLLDSLAIKYGFRLLHDRLIPKSRANIDHLAITPFGVFVIDAKNYQGMVRVKDKSGFFEKSSPMHDSFFLNISITDAQCRDSFLRAREARF